VLTVLSMIDYLYKARDLIGFAPKKADKAVLGPDLAFMDEDVQTMAEDGSSEPDAGASGATQGGTSAHRAGPEYARDDAVPDTSYASIVESGAQPNVSEGARTQHASDTDSTAADGASEAISNGASSMRDLPGGDAVSAKARTTAQGIVEEATAKGLVVGTAESLTGGLIASSLTAVPGSSAVVAGGIVSYMLSIKDHVLGVDGEVLAREGAVCETVAIQMAEGARRTLSCDIAVSVTGIAGPGGAEPGKPVGTVWMGLSSPQGTDAVCLHFDGDRDAVRRQTVETALEALRNAVDQA
jgi:PncC family amidohydrolase